MTLENVGIIGELMAAIATIATLAYLAVQIRASTAATRAEGRRTMDVVGLDVVARIAENPEHAEFLMRGLYKPDTLSSAERFRFTLSISLFFSMHETTWVEVQQGTLAPEELGKQFDRLKDFILSPGGRDWWRGNSGMYSREYREYFESRVASVE